MADRQNVPPNPDDRATELRNESVPGWADMQRQAQQGDLQAAAQMADTLRHYPELPRDREEA